MNIGQPIEEYEIVPDDIPILVPDKEPVSVPVKVP